MKDVLGNLSFRRLALAYAVGELVEWLAIITLTLTVFRETGSALATTALFLSTKLVPSILAPVLASRTDRYATPRGIGALSVLEAGLLFALAFAATEFSLIIVCSLALADGIVAALTRTFIRAAVATTTEPTGQLRAANSFLSVLFAVMNVAGPLAGGLGAAILAPEVALIAAGGFLVWLGLLLIVDTTLASAEEDREVPWSGRLRETIAYLKTNPRLTTVFSAEIIATVLGTIPTPIIVVFAQEAIGAGDGGYAVLTTAWGVGITFGSLLYIRARKGALGTVWIWASVIMGLGFLALSGAPDLQVAAAAAVFGGVGNGLQSVAGTTLIQEAVTTEFQVRIAGLLETVFTLAPAIGFVLGGVIAATWSSRGAILIAGVGLVASAVGAWIIRSYLRPPPAPA